MKRGLEFPGFTGLSPPLVSGFELIRAQPAEMTVASRSIIEGVDVVSDVGGGQLAVLVDLFLNAFFLQAAEEGFGNGVVPAITFPSRTGLPPTAYCLAHPNTAPRDRPLERRGTDRCG